MQHFRSSKKYIYTKTGKNRCHGNTASDMKKKENKRQSRRDIKKDWNFAQKERMKKNRQSGTY